MKDLPADFRDMLVELADAKVEFVVIGGPAEIYDGVPSQHDSKDAVVVAKVHQQRRSPPGGRRQA